MHRNQWSHVRLGYLCRSFMSLILLVKWKLNVEDLHCYQKLFQGYFCRIFLFQRFIIYYMFFTRNQIFQQPFKVCIWWKTFCTQGDIENSADDFKCLYVNPEHLNLLGTIYVIFYIDKFYLPHILNAYYMIYSEIY